MVQTAQKTNDKKIYPETLYYGKRVGRGIGHQPVYKRLLPGGEPTELSPEPSQKLCNHSPDGFNWGYGGSGLAQTSLALLLDATTDPEMALAYYQQFKWDKVAGWGKEWKITRGEILSWIAWKQIEDATVKAGKN